MTVIEKLTTVPPLRRLLAAACGVHNLHLDHPDETLATVRELVRRVDAGS